VLKKTKITGFIIFIVTIIFYALNITTQINAGDIWIDGYGTSTTSGMWNSGIRSDRETNIKPPFVVNWMKQGWRGEGVNVVTVGDWCIVYNGYVYLGEGNCILNDLSKWEEPGWVWAWDIATGVTKTGYPLGPLDSGVIGIIGSNIVIGDNRLYALTVHKLWGWDISGPVPVTLPGFPVEITETVGNDINKFVFTDCGITYYRGKIYFTTISWSSLKPLYLYCKSGIDGTEVWRRRLNTGEIGGGTGGVGATAWEGRIYVAGIDTSKIYCFDAETGADCSGYPIQLTPTNMRTVPIIEDGKMYIGTESGYFYRIDAASGEIEWVFETPYYIKEREEIVSTASIWGDKVYFGVHNAKLYGLYKETGTLVPGFPVDGVVLDGPISTANGVVYTNVEYKTFAIDAETGEILWQSEMPPYHSGGQVGDYNFPAVTIGNGYIVSTYGAMNCIVVYKPVSPTATRTYTVTMTITPTETITETHTNTPTQTRTYTNTPSATITNTASITATWTNTWTATMTPTATATVSETASATPSATASETPGEFYLKLIGNSPNPVVENTDIIYEIGREAEIEVRIYTISGERVREIRGRGEKGRNSIMWDTRNKRGRGVATGVYIYSIEAVDKMGGKRYKEWGKIAVIR